MSDGLVPTSQSDGLLPSQGFAEARTENAPAQSPLERPVAALRRYKWLIVAVTLVSAVLGVVGSRFITPEFEVRATVWVSVAQVGPNAGRAGPIQGAMLLSSGQWVDLFRSYRVVDEVVRKLTLYVSPEKAEDKVLFPNFSLAERYAPGTYDLHLNKDTKTWVMTSVVGEVDKGSSADSIGRKVGFRWTIPDSIWQGSGIRKVRFSVVPPRERSMGLLSRVNPRIALGSNFLWLTYSDIDRNRAQRTMNTWVHEFVKVAGDLKKANIGENTTNLAEQLNSAEKRMQEAERAYQTFRVNTITLPTEGGPVAAGAPGGGTGTNADPALSSFYTQKIEYNNLRYDREAVESVIRSASAGNTPYEGLLLIPSVATSPATAALRAAFDRVYALNADARLKSTTFTDQHPAVIAVNKELEQVKTQTIPSLADQLLQQLREREGDYQRRIQAASSELQQIPPRTIEERGLSRAVTVSEQLYTSLKARYAEAQLAEASASPDVSVLDTAIAPVAPTKNTGLMVMLGGVFGGLMAAIALAILLDQIDRRFRYAHQATSELGLVVAGAVPKIPKGGIDSRSPEQVVQFLESFRTLRMHVMHSVPGQRVTLAVTSAAPGDGKSLISTNLALSFAEVGLKTVLIDGDTRRGSLHRMHGLTAAGGLTEYLIGGIDEAQAVRATAHQNLSILTCGARHPRSPELLASPRLKRLVDNLSQRFDVVIFDTPPLAAGIDGYAISAVAGRVLMVLRMGQTERRLASAKLSILDRLPVDVVGAVLNAVPLSGEFQYYTYTAGYGLDGGETAGELVESS